MGDGLPYTPGFDPELEMFPQVIKDSSRRVWSFLESGLSEPMGTIYTIEHAGISEEKPGRVHVLDMIGHEHHHRAKMMFRLRQLDYTDYPVLPIS